MRRQDRSAVDPHRHGDAGARDPQTGLMKNCNTTELNGKPFKEDLERRLGVPVLIANDANCFALAETHLGRCASTTLMPR